MKQTIIEKAIKYATDKHEGQLYGAKPFIEHPMQVYYIIEMILPDDYALQCAAVLHDVLEDTPATYAELKEEFTEEVAELVKEVTKLEYNTFPFLKTRRGIILKFADRLSNLANMSLWDSEKQMRYIRKSKFWKT